MKKYLLILFSYAGLEGLNKVLFNKLKSGDRLFVRAVILEGVPKLYNHLTSDLGFLGDKVANDIEESVLEGHQCITDNYLKNLEETAAENNIDFTKHLIDHHQLDKMKKDILEKDLDAVFINFSKNEFISDQVKEKEIKDFLKKAGLKHYSFYDGKLE
ncbi:hypothetical protein [Halanaerobium hydrogeniformans]|uniref:Uncharacterized protein n=1 Tax=Halanaerobium hydrogeniformans TaxID=656519 RepID=E4RLZ8_HALHG|nr:hypothetical protein [Halanaerobium hydrogeniformans]ADQ14081.1 hypothetical protein Halsa_0629 [Halanaerobium hydrogeniformans]